MTVNNFHRLAIVLSVVLFSACGMSEKNDPQAIFNTAGSDGISKIYRDSTYSIVSKYDVVYGQGLSHSDWNSNDSSVMDLKLDIYSPKNNGTLRPAVIFIHGGGFMGGDKGNSALGSFPEYFAQRGIVGISINYRLVRDHGTLPAELNDKINSINGLSNKRKNQAKAMYPAARDAKAALRWVSANANQLGIDPNLVSVMGGSAGSFIAVTLGATNPEDFTNELSQSEDPTLASTNLEADIKVKSVVNHWGGATTVNLLETAYGLNRWDKSDAAISIVHGTKDKTVPFNQAEELVAIYKRTGASYEFYPLAGAGHGAWEFKHEGKSLKELSFDFITRMLELPVKEN